MRDYHRKGVETERPHLNLVRGVDGRLRPAGADDITDIWAEQKQVRESEPSPQERREFAAQVEHKPEADWLSANFEHDAQVRTQRPARRIQLPNISLPHLKPAKKHVIGGAVVLAVVIVSVISFNLIGGKPENTVAQDPKQQTPTDVLNAADIKGPNFTAILPAGKSIEDLGGWARVSPADKDPVFAYTDMVDGVQLNVSQQRLPETLRNNTAQELAKLAEGFAANQKLIAGDTTAYLGTSIRGPQSVIFVKQDLLILIKSATKLTNERWIEYIGSLH